MTTNEMLARACARLARRCERLQERAECSEMDAETETKNAIIERQRAMKAEAKLAEAERRLAEHEGYPGIAADLEATKRERDAEKARADANKDAWYKCADRANAAEREVERLRGIIRRMADVIRNEGLTREALDFLREADVPPAEPKPRRMKANPMFDATNYHGVEHDANGWCDSKDAPCEPADGGAK